MNDCSGVDTLPNETTNDIFDMNTKTWTHYQLNGASSINCDNCTKRDTKNNTYYYNRQSYLDSRAKSYRINNVISANNETNTNNSYDLPVKCTTTKFYQGVNKLSNPQYSNNNAVSSSTRLERLKYETIKKSYYSYNNIPSYKVNLNYRGHTSAPNFLKNKISNGCVNNKGKRRCMKFL